MKVSVTRNVVAVNPFRVRMWSLHDRCEDHVSEATCKAEIDSFEKHGQIVPALGRMLHGDPDYDIELIYGARRLFVARYLNIALLVEVREISDREALIAMDIENRQRTDISPYERALSYARWLRSGHFGSQDDIARALKISSSRVSRLLRLAKLPAVIVNAFAIPLEICESWGSHIMDALEDPGSRRRVIEKARELAALSTPLPAKRVYRELIAAAASGRKPKPAARVEIVRDGQGSPLFRIRQLSTSVSLVVPSQKLSAAALAEIRTRLAEILKRTSREAVDTKRERSYHATLLERDTCHELIALSGTQSCVQSELTRNEEGSMSLQSSS